MSDNIYDKNIKAVAKYLQDGSKGVKTDDVGLEIEHFILDKNGERVMYKHGVDNVISDMSPHYNEHFYSDGFLIGLACDDYSITLEPGAQMEISIRPTSDISEIEKIYKSFLSVAEPVMQKYSYHFSMRGYTPCGKVSEMELIPKKRYEYMDKYFKCVGTNGINMMRGTASVQVSIDFADEEDCGNKLRTANAISPLLSLICDNSPVFENEPYTKNILRTQIWENVDNDRCGVFDVLNDTDFSFEKYAEFICNSPAILVLNGDETVYTGNVKIRDIYKDRLIEKKDIEHLLSMFFPDVRLKKYIEIRPADSMTIEYALSYATLIKGIFASDFTFFKSTESIYEAKRNIIAGGYDAIVYGENVHDLVMMLFDKASKSLCDSDREYLNPLFELAKNKKTLKEM